NFLGQTSVKFGTAPAPNIRCLRFFCFFGIDDLEVVTAPPQGSNSATVDVTVTAAGGTSAPNTADQYTYGATPRPSVTIVSPNSGPTGTTVFITGTSLGASSQ